MQYGCHLGFRVTLEFPWSAQLEIITRDGRARAGLYLLPGGFSYRCVESHTHLNERENAWGSKINKQCNIMHIRVNYKTLMNIKDQHFREKMRNRQN